MKFYMLMETKFPFDDLDSVNPPKMATYKTKDEMNQAVAKAKSDGLSFVVFKMECIMLVPGVQP